jgi:hypothetical protein
MANKKGDEDITVQLNSVQLDPNRAVWTRIADELVVLDLQNSSYLSVNSTGALVWSLLEAGTTRDALVESILAEFDTDHATAQKDVDRFLGELSERGLLKTTGLDTLIRN